MRTLRIMIGCALAMSVIMPPLPRAHAEDLYMRIRTAVKQEERKDIVEDDVAAFVADVIRTKRPAWSSITTDDVPLAMRGQLAKLCEKGKAIGGAAGSTVNAVTCVNIANDIATLARREQDLRAFGRKLQAIATRDELPVEGLRGDATDLAAHQQILLQLWKAGAGTEQTGELPGLREIPVTEEDLAGELAAIAGNLAALPREEQIAAVWRYRHGVRTSGMQDDEKDPTGTERQWLLGSWENIETPLNTIWETLLTEAAEMNLQDGEYGVLLSVPIAEGAEGLTGNVYVWGTVDHDEKGSHPLGDVGLRWDIATEPVMPSLMAGTAILGGAFPPTAVDGYGLCGHPLAAQGYLCRAIEEEDDENTEGPCAEEPLENETSISLTSCTNKAPDIRTFAGPEICAGIDWHGLENDDERYVCTLRSEERNESLIRCSSSCKNDAGGDDEWHTYAKENDGGIAVCLDSDDTNVPYQYNLMRALSVVEEICTIPFDEPLPTDCCRLAGEANNAMCRMMQEDGIFVGDNGESAISSENIPFTIQTCTEAMTQEFCIQGGFDCALTRDYGAGGVEKFTEEIEGRAMAKSLFVDEECVDVIGSPDPRNQALIDAIERRDDIGRPDREITYLNTIGNQLCAAGNYLEETFKYHTVVGGRIPFTVMDSAFPWAVDGLADENDSGQSAEDPEVETGAEAILKILEGSADTGGPLPLYRPALLAKAYDIGQCGALGLPPLVPPELCTVDAQRRFRLPLGSFFATHEQALAENDATRTAMEEAGRGAAAVGTRLTNTYYGNYLHTTLQSLSDVLVTTDDLLERMRLQSSPSVMCPSESTPDLVGGSALSVMSSPAGSRASSFSSSSVSTR